MNIFKIIIVIFCLTIANVKFAEASDKLDIIKERLLSAKMIEFKIEHIIVSEVFGDSDTTFGIVSLADDGRYNAIINKDIYLFDGECIWDYSYENAQITKRCLKENEEFENSLFFLKDLDKYYQISIVKKDIKYRLFKKSKNISEIPDSLLVNLDDTTITSIEYLDLNNDINHVNFLSITTCDKVGKETFMMNPPDSIEVINLP